VICLLAGPIPAGAAIYGWHDPQGVAHYVSDPEDVPTEYRAQVVTVVKDMPVPPAPASPELPPRVEPPLPVEQQPAAEEVVETSFESGYRAGLEAATAGDPGPWIGSIVQNVQIIQPPPQLPAFTSSYPFFGPVLARGGRFHTRRRFLPPSRGRFIQGPAGPPPLGAPGPPPVSFPRR
jgi:hypothetical protein